MRISRIWTKGRRDVHTYTKALKHSKERLIKRPPLDGGLKHIPYPHLEHDRLDAAAGDDGLVPLQQRQRHPVRDLVPLAEDAVPRPDRGLRREVGRKAGGEPAQGHGLDLEPVRGEAGLLLGDQALQNNGRMAVRCGLWWSARAKGDSYPSLILILLVPPQAA